VDKKMHYIYQDGPAVYKFAVRKMAEATAKVLERNGVTARTWAALFRTRPTSGLLRRRRTGWGWTRSG
jgi:3-oxoacyl-[acyl-carrier-protein] synthase III